MSSDLSVRVQERLEVRDSPAGEERLAVTDAAQAWHPIEAGPTIRTLAHRGRRADGVEGDTVSDQAVPLMAACTMTSRLWLCASRP